MNQKITFSIDKSIIDSNNDSLLLKSVKEMLLVKTTNQEKLVSFLNSNGYTVTNERLKILDVVSTQKEKYSVSIIYKQVNKNLQISYDCVQKTLKLFVKAGLVEKIKKNRIKKNYFKNK